MTALIRIAERRSELYARPRAILRWGLPIGLLVGLTGALIEDLHPPPPLRVEHRAGHAPAHHAHRVYGTSSPLDRTFTTLSRAMYVSFPHWLAAHPGQWCPSSVRDLMRASRPSALVSNLDAWRHPMELRCAETPAGHTIQLRSPGADGQFDTPDDLYVGR